VVRTIIFGCCFLFGVQAWSAPSAKDVKEFLEYYYKGSGQAPVLVELKHCADISKAGENKHNCTETASKGAVGESSFVWMWFTGPKDDKFDNIIIQYNQGGLTRWSKTISITGGLRYRVWKTFRPTKAGDWTVKVLLEASNDIVELGKMEIVVE